jgi:hypothetical protein
LKLIDELLTVPERESGGSTALERFDYQTAWGLAKVIHLHAANTNYAVAFEFHDDIVELDDADAPNRARFYQVKTLKSGSWTFTRLSKRESNKPSFSGKMFDNFKRFGAATEKLVFVSNQGCSELGNEHKEYPLSSARDADFEKFKQSMKAEFSTFNDEHAQLYFFSYSDLSLGSFDRTLMADIAEFIRNQLGLEEANFRAFGLMLVEECRKRSKN